MATADQILARQDAAVTALENATEELLEQKALVQSAPRIAGEAKAAAEAAETKAAQAVTTANSALPKAGGRLTGAVYQNIATPDLADEELAKVIAIYGSKDADGFNIGGTYVEVRDGKTMTHMVARQKNETSGQLALSAYASLVIGSDGSKQFILPASVSAYDHRAVDMMYLKNYASENFVNPITLHVFGANASDTADLKNGRGLTEDKPFATLMAAIKYAAQNYAGSSVVVITLHGNGELTGTLPRLHNLGYVKIDSDATTRTLTVSDVAHVGGCLVIGKLKLVAQGGAANFFGASGWSSDAATILFQGASEFSGVVSNAAVTASYGAKIIVSAQLTGNVTGKRFNLSGGSMLISSGIGATAIPGNQDGISDSSSKVI